MPNDRLFAPLFVPLLAPGRPILLAVAGLIAAPVHAEPAQRQHGAHVHGVATLNLALDGDHLYLELDSPAANLVGFEHPPGDVNEWQAVDQALEALRAGQDLFLPSPAAGCWLVSAEVEDPWHDDKEHDHDHEAGAHHEEEHAEHDHDAGERHEDEHGEHDHDAGEPHTEEQAEHDHEAAEHADIHAKYLFECARPVELTGLEVRLFERFPATERLRLQYVLGADQGAVTLTAGQPDVQFGRR